LYKFFAFFLLLFLGILSLKQFDLLINIHLVLVEGRFLFIPSVHERSKIVEIMDCVDQNCKKSKLFSVSKHTTESVRLEVHKLLLDGVHYIFKFTKVL
jgi:hypothetical protein